MTTTERAALGVVGALVGGIALYAVIGTIGLGQFPLRTVSMPVRVDADPACRVFPDGGCCSTATYRTRNFQVRVQADGGWLESDGGERGAIQAWQPQKADGGLCFLPFKAGAAGAAEYEWVWNDDGSKPDNSHWCACRPDDGGVCNVDRPVLADGGPDLLADGGQRRMAGPLGRLLQPSENPAGPGCERTPCNVAAGIPSGECGLP